MKKTMLLSMSVLFAAGLLSCNGNLLFDVDSGTPRLDPRPLEAYERAIWIVGGQSSTYIGTAPDYSADLVSQVDVFDPVTETWYPAVTQVPIPVTFAGVAGYNGKLYVSGGWDATGTVRSIHQIYDLASDTWSTGTPLPVNRAGHELIAVDGSFLFATNGFAGNIDAPWANQNVWYRYTIDPGTWVYRVAYGYTDMSFAQVGGIIHTIGGRTSATAIASYHEGYWPNPTYVSDTTTSATVEVLLQRLSAASSSWQSPGGSTYLLTAGGITGAALTVTPAAYLFRGLTSTSAALSPLISYLEAPFEAPKTWVNHTASLPQGQAFGTAVTAQDKLYVFGGTTALPTPIGSDAVQVFDLDGFPGAVVSVTAGPAMPVGRFGHRAVQIMSR